MDIKNIVKKNEFIAERLTQSCLCIIQHLINQPFTTSQNEKGKVFCPSVITFISH